MPESSVNDSLTEKEAAKYLRLSLADFRSLVHASAFKSEWFIPYEQLPEGRRPKPKKGGNSVKHPAFVPMYRKDELDERKQGNRVPRKSKAVTSPAQDDEWLDIIGE